MLMLEACLRATDHDNVVKYQMTPCGITVSTGKLDPELTLKPFKNEFITVYIH